jgi:hypothetical protein
MKHNDGDTATRETTGAAAENPVHALYSVIEDSARMLGVPCSREKVLPILSTYGDDLAEAVVAFRIATSARHAGDLDCRFKIPQGADPYAQAVSNGFIARTDHPVGALLSDIVTCCPIDSYGIDFGVVGGFKKIWLVLPPDGLQPISNLADVPSMPPSLGENLSFFVRHGLSAMVGIIGIDYRDRSVNLYLNEQPECFAPETIRSMIREVNEADPSEQMLKVGQMAFGFYVTLNWDSPRLERISFSVATSDPTDLPVRIDPEIERFVRFVQRSDISQKFVYYVASSPDGEYCKLQSFYRWRPVVFDLMKAADPKT